MTLVFDIVVGTMFTGFVFYDSLFAIWLQECVHSFGVVVIPSLPLALDVMVFQVMNGVIVVVVWWRLFALKKLIWTLYIDQLPDSQYIPPSGGVLRLRLVRRLLPLRPGLEELRPAKHFHYYQNSPNFQITHKAVHCCLSLSTKWEPELNWLNPVPCHYLNQLPVKGGNFYKNI